MGPNKPPVAQRFSRYTNILKMQLGSENGIAWLIVAHWVWLARTEIGVREIGHNHYLSQKIAFSQCYYIGSLIGLTNMHCAASSGK